MPDLTGPLLSLSASGTVAKTLTYSSWRGIKYARQRVVPANPRSTDQLKIRSTFTFLSDVWKYGPTALHQTYLLASKGRPLTDRNLFLSTNTSALYLAGTINALKASPGTGGAPALTSIGATPHSGHANVSIDPGSTPPGWAIVLYWAIAVHPGNPTSTTFVPPISSDSDASGSGIDLLGLTNGITYLVSGYVEYTDAAGRTQFSPSTNTVVTPA